ncbi:MAG: hypothetical protein LBE83_01905, partial [Propionibacteriaceae bacterium]|nr:hypothetical protein [Propionibacteriaceae bacterium]
MERFPTQTWIWGLDAAALTVMIGACGIGLWPAFGGPQFLRPLIIGLILGLGIAWLGAWRRWSAIIVTLVVIGAYFVFGAAAALWTKAIGGVIPD